MLWRRVERLERGIGVQGICMGILIVKEGGVMWVFCMHDIEILIYQRRLK